MSAPIEDRYTYEQVQEIASFLKKKASMKPKVAIICGSGLSPLADNIDSPVQVNYEEIPNFPQSTVQGHVGCLVFGQLATIPVVVMKGRFHFYEGYPLSKVTLPCRVFKLMGCTHLIVTNAAGGVNQTYRVGDIMLLKDHLNFLGFAGVNPLKGPNDERFGVRFPSMNNVYEKDIRIYALKVAKQLGIEKKIHQGVYASLGGPCYESVAEMRMLAACGADAVGMSTVPEVIVAKHCGLQIFAFSLITNEGVLDYLTKKAPNHLEVLAAAKAMEEPLQEFIKEIVSFIGSQKPCKC